MLLKDLEDGVVHLWFADLNWSQADLQAGYQLLSHDERCRADRFKVKRAREEFIASHSVLRRLLASYLEAQPEALCFAKKPKGKPYLLDNQTQLRFNLSHTRGRAMIGLTRRQAIGVDIECHDSRAELEQLAERFFAEPEYAELVRLPKAMRVDAFYRIWTLKEAFIKASGEGLSFGLANFIVTSTPKANDCLLSIHDSDKLAREWTLRPVFIEEDLCSAAFAVRGLIKSIQKKHWST